MFTITLLVANVLVASVHAEPGSDSPAEVPAAETCFGPKEDCKAKILGYMKAATKSLDVAVYEINDAAFSKPLWTLSKQIKLRVLTDEIEAERPQSAIPRMARAGIEVRFGQQPGIYHDNFVIRDGLAVETGSFNLTDHSAASNHENQVYVLDPRVAARYQKDFDEAWINAKPWSPPPPHPGKLRRPATAAIKVRPHQKRRVSTPKSSTPAPTASSNGTTGGW